MNKKDSSEAVASTTILPDGSAFSVASLPLPADHWLYAPRCTEWDAVRDTSADVPHPILTHAQREAVIAAVRYAIRGATMCGNESDFDPDALVQNAVYALCGPYGFDAPAPQADAAPSDVEIPYVERFRESHGEGGGVYPDEDGDFVRYSDFVEHATRAAIVAGGAQEPIGEVRRSHYGGRSRNIGVQVAILYPDAKVMDGTKLYAALPRVAETVPPTEPAYSWLPIKTAPRDGTNILIRFGRDGASQAKYVPGTPHPWKFIDTNDGVTWLINHAVDTEYGPSHWMPIPSVHEPEPGIAASPAADSQDERASVDVDVAKAVWKDWLAKRGTDIDFKSHKPAIELVRYAMERAASAPAHASAAGAPTQVATTHSTPTIEKVERFIYDDICDERIRQDKQWGGPAHDDAHGVLEWLGFIDYQTDKAIAETAGFQTDRSIAPYVRARLVKVAALAVAGMASIDRCFGAASSGGDQA